MCATFTARATLLLLVYLGAAAVWAEPVQDCQFALAPQRCAVRQQGLRSCSDLSGGARRICLHEFEPRLRCAGRDHDSCKALTAAQRHCDALDGAARRACVQPYLPPCRAFTRTAECRR
jgi:hypothetical protein